MGVLSFPLQAQGIASTLAVLVLSCTPSRPVAEIRKPWPVIKPEYPKNPDLDYRPRPGLAHVALPHFDGETGAFEGSIGRYSRFAFWCRRCRCSIASLA